MLDQTDVVCSETTTTTTSTSKEVSQTSLTNKKPTSINTLPTTSFTNSSLSPHLTATLSNPIAETRNGSVFSTVDVSPTASPNQLATNTDQAQHSATTEEALLITEHGNFFLSAGDIAGITIGVILVVVLFGITTISFLRQKQKFNNSLSNDKSNGDLNINSKTNTYANVDKKLLDKIKTNNYDDGKFSNMYEKLEATDNDNKIILHSYQSKTVSKPNFSKSEQNNEMVKNDLENSIIFEMKDNVLYTASDPKTDKLPAEEQYVSGSLYEFAESNPTTDALNTTKISDTMTINVLYEGYQE